MQASGTRGWMRFLVGLFVMSVTVSAAAAACNDDKKPKRPRYFDPHTELLGYTNSGYAMDGCYLAPADPSGSAAPLPGQPEGARTEIFEAYVALTQYPPLTPEEQSELGALDRACACAKAKPSAVEKKHRARHDALKGKKKKFIERPRDMNVSMIVGPVGLRATDWTLTVSISGAGKPDQTIEITPATLDLLPRAWERYLVVRSIRATFAQPVLAAGTPAHHGTAVLQLASFQGRYHYVGVVTVDSGTSRFVVGRAAIPGWGHAPYWRQFLKRGQDAEWEGEPPRDERGNGSQGNNGVGNGTDPRPPGNPPVNDGAGTAPGTPGNQGGANGSTKK